LAVTTAQPSALFPALPTLAASGLPGYDAVLISAMFAPAKTPPIIISRLNQEVVKVLNMPDVKEKFFNTGIEVVGSSSEELAATIKTHMAVWGQLIKEKGIRAE
jgi:tripartite-type tricarboxylate transporter receptor subunit TctC